MKKLFPEVLFLLLLVLPLVTTAQQRVRKEIAIPDIPGYLTLKCDLHTHTVFSDGLVWPTVRPEEAWREGLDAIAITDHIEYQPHKSDLPTIHNRSYELALPVARKLGLILIRGAEITREMPPGHFNALFLKDAAALDVKDWREAFKKASEQGAYLMWNHPGWRQPHTIPVWYEEHDEILKNGWVHGIEIANEFELYPLAFYWCLEKGLTPMGCSDIHNPIQMDYNFPQKEHRAITLVFARERTEEAIREALFAGRTVVYAKNTLYGDKKFLSPVFDASVYTVTPEIKASAGKSFYLQVHNASNLDLHLVQTLKNNFVEPAPKVVLPAHRTGLVRVRTLQDTPPGKYDIELEYEVTNMQFAPDQYLQVQLSFTLIADEK